MATSNHRNHNQIVDLSTCPQNSLLEYGYRLMSIDSVVEKRQEGGRPLICACVTVCDRSKNFKRFELLPTGYLRKKHARKLIAFYESRIELTG